MVAMVAMIVVGVVDVAIVAVRAACIVALVARCGKRYTVEHKSETNISGSCLFVWDKMSQARFRSSVMVVTFRGTGVCNP